MDKSREEYQESGLQESPNSPAHPHQPCYLKFIFGESQSQDELLWWSIVERRYKNKYKWKSGFSWLCLAKSQLWLALTHRWMFRIFQADNDQATTPPPLFQSVENRDDWQIHKTDFSWPDKYRCWNSNQPTFMQKFSIHNFQLIPKYSMSALAAGHFHFQSMYCSWTELRIAET